MNQRSSFQRFLGELRRRHVPQTAAVYLVAAWAAIEFADVVVPNLDWPQAIVTAVIVAAAVGFPVVLVLAWLFDWGPGGIHRTEPAPGLDHGSGYTDPSDPSGTARTGTAGVGASTGPQRSAWPAAVGVLAVAIAGAVAVTMVLGGDEEGTAADASGERPSVGRPSGIPEPPAPPGAGLEDFGELGPAFSDSAMRRTIEAALGGIEGLELDELRDLGRQAAGPRGLFIHEPEVWRFGPSPVPLARGDTLLIEGLARDTAGVQAVLVDGQLVAEPDSLMRMVPFSTMVVGTGDRGIRRLPILVRSATGTESLTEYRIAQLPEGEGPP